MSEPDPLYPSMPAYPPPLRSNGTVSARLIAQVYAMVLADPTVLGLIFVGGVASSLVFAGIAAPVWLWGNLDLSLTGQSLGSLALYGVAAWASAFVSVLFAGAVVAAGAARVEGTPVTTGRAFAMAWERRKELAAWALATTVVSVLQVVLRRFGLIGALTSLAAGLAWAVATMLVLPVIIVEGKMPADAVRESVSLVKGRLGLTIRSKVRLYLPWTLASFVGLMLVGGGILAFVHYRHETPEWAMAGLILAFAGTVCFFAAVSVQSAAAAFLNLLLYRHAHGLPVPDVDARDLPTLQGVAWPPGPTPAT